MPDSKVKIMIVEDESIIAIDIKITLQRLGYTVVSVVSSGEKAIENVEHSNPDIILMDISLSGEMDGIMAVEEIRKNRNIPVVYLTALTDEETLQRARVTEPFGYLLKPFDERSLHSTIEMALYKHKADIELKRRTRELEEEKIKSDRLLHNIFPAEVVKELKQKGIVSPRYYNMITILFTDFQEFTKISSQLSPEKLIQELNDIFINFDTIIEKYGLEKLKTIGDSYMVCGGLPNESDDHAEKIIHAAIEMQKYINDRNKYTGSQWKMRAGIHSGSVIAGIVGNRKLTYDIWGDAVNIASRMETHSVAGRINISGDTYKFVKDQFDFEYRGKLQVKGKGKIDMYFVNGLNDSTESVSKNSLLKSI
jgi:adenylate cyclase